MTHPFYSSKTLFEVLAPVSERKGDRDLAPSFSKKHTHMHKSFLQMTVRLGACPSRVKGPVTPLCGNVASCFIKRLLLGLTNFCCMDSDNLQRGRDPNVVAGRVWGCEWMSCCVCVFLHSYTLGDRIYENVS